MFAHVGGGCPNDDKNDGDEVSPTYQPPDLIQRRLPDKFRRHPVIPQLRGSVRTLWNHPHSTPGRIIGNTATHCTTFFKKRIFPDLELHGLRSRVWSSLVIMAPWMTRSFAATVMRRS